MLVGPAALAAEEVPGEPPPVPLDQLLKLPDSVDYQAENVGGRTADEWRQRFREARTELAVALGDLDRVQAEMEDSGADSAWSVAPPGLGQLQQDPADGAPSNYGLTAELKRAKAEAARAERALKDLHIEANLAGVPESWRADE